METKCVYLYQYKTRAEHVRYFVQIAVKVAAFTQKISPVKAEKTDSRLKIAKKNQ